MPKLRTFFIAFVLLIIPLYVHAAPPHGFVGVNTATWDSYADTPRVAHLLRAAGITALRYPGGSTSDGFDWTKPLLTTTAQFAHLAKSIGAVATITANYGSGSPQMAAAWVAYCNASPSSKVAIGRDDAGRDWKTAGYWASLRAAKPLHRDDGRNALRAGHRAPYYFENWEIGNECFGSWEEDDHTPKHDPVLYAMFVISAARLMHAVDSKAHIGVVAADIEWDTQESVHNPLDAKSATSDWTAVVLSSLSTHGFQPGFLAFHHYAEQSGQESDALLFQDVKLWPGMVGRLRSLLAAYYGKKADKIGIACTECNSVAFNPGTQTTGEANAIYYAQIAPVAERLGLKDLIWWDLHNFPSTTGYDTHSALNRFPFGDYGILGSKDRLDQPYPIYYAIKQFATHGVDLSARQGASANPSEPQRVQPR